jgi:hypothetical protein
MKWEHQGRVTRRVRVRVHAHDEAAMMGRNRAAVPPKSWQAQCIPYQVPGNQTNQSNNYHNRVAINQLIQLSYNHVFDSSLSEFAFSVAHVRTVLPSLQM